MLKPRQRARLRRDTSGPNRVRRARKMAGLTQVQMAAALGWQQKYISDVENGTFHKLPLRTAQRLAAFFTCTIEELFPAKNEAAA